MARCLCRGLAVSVSGVFFTQEQGEREQGRLVDALAPGGDEGRDKLR